MKHGLKLRLAGLVMGLSFGLVLFSLVLFLVSINRYRMQVRGQWAVAWAGITEGEMRLGHPHPLAWVGGALRVVPRFKDAHEFWLADGEGKIVDSSTPSPIPADWHARPASPRQSVYDVENQRYALLTVRLSTPKPLYLVIRTNKWNEMGIIGIKVLFAFALWVALGSVLISMAVVFYYFRSKASEAKVVLARLQEGELDVRFPMRRFDEIGQLMGQFNLMAQEIERLVKRLRKTEQARALMLQEISHDIRTPLSSCRTVVDLANNHFDRLEEKDKKRCLSIASAEIEYLQQLIDDLFFLAEMEEPRYRNDCSPIDISEILRAEIERRVARSEASGKRIHWELHVAESASARIQGSLPLVIRLVRNALDNAAKFAEARVSVSVSALPGQKLELRIIDDGPGLSEEQKQGFGIRRTQRLSSGSLVSGKSLGLGSVIMREISQLHGGTMEIACAGAGSSAGTGTALRFVFPAIAPAPQVKIKQGDAA